MPTNLPACDYRVDIDGDERIYCRHTSMIAPLNLVPGIACRVCHERTNICESPRPVPTDDELLEILQADPKEMPPLATQAWNLVGAVKDFVADGLKTVTTEQYEARLAICDECDQRVGDRCVKCGCHLSIKARGRAFKCPLRKWSEPTA